jgi:hypothetical protein
VAGHDFTIDLTVYGGFEFERPKSAEDTNILPEEEADVSKEKARRGKTSNT